MRSAAARSERSAITSKLIALTPRETFCPSSCVMQPENRNCISNREHRDGCSGLPHHLSHDVITQVSREVTDASGPPRGSRLPVRGSGSPYTRFAAAIVHAARNLNAVWRARRRRKAGGSSVARGSRPAQCRRSPRIRYPAIQSDIGRLSQNLPDTGLLRVPALQAGAHRDTSPRSDEFSRQASICRRRITPPPDSRRPQHAADPSAAPLHTRQSRHRWRRSPEATPRLNCAAIKPGSAASACRYASTASGNERRFWRATPRL